MIIKNIHVFGYGQAGLQTVNITSAGKIHIQPEHLEPNSVVMDAKGKYALMPGMMDAHIHGYNGSDFADGDNIKTITRGLGEAGVSYCVATLVSLSFEKLKIALTAIDQYIAEQNKTPTAGAAIIVGVHLEGPFISKECKGAHDAQVLQEEINVEAFSKIVRLAPHVQNWKITLAPELKGAIEFIKQTRNFTVDNRQVFVHVFIGHSNAAEKCIEQALAAGAIGFTHLGNANQEQAARNNNFEPQQSTSNVVRWVMKNAQKSEFFAELICDEQHLSATFVSTLSNLLPNRIMVITDALGPTGLCDGEYKLGELPILKQKSKFVLKSDPNKLAGSATTLPQIVQTYCKNFMHLPAFSLWEKIFHAAVICPRKASLGTAESLHEEQHFTIFDEKGNLVLSACNGKLYKFSPFSTHENKLELLGLFSNAQTALNATSQADYAVLDYQI
ncbi:hypothetical protein [Legionella septentrionalis]|uniref:hypothetical protein n=1 Tax=Legionella septentrionalis TaxID=2498109 RepID=UPI000F8F5904|nr:hypothetical protein [Legionella septentrionalis]RUR16793.1 hypothetical protein ELY10_02640 [Legionella septentrionalis]